MFSPASARQSGHVCTPSLFCGCATKVTGLEQSLDELDFARSACAAATNNNLSRLKHLIERRPDSVNEAAGGYVPLHFAARGGHLDAVCLLLEARALVDATTPGGATSLHRAAVAGHASVCDALLQANARVDARDSDGNTPLHKASSDEVALLLLGSCPQASVIVNRRGELAKCAPSVCIGVEGACT